MLVHLEQALGIRTTPPPLLKYDHQLVIVLQDRMVDLALFDASGVHAETALRTEVYRRPGLKGYGFYVALDLRFCDNRVGVF